VRIVNLSQNSADWAEWRKKGLGASDAPVIMGNSPWSTPFKLWAEKTGLIPRQETDNVYALAAMQRGHDLEPKARELFEKAVGALYPPLSAHHDEYEYIRASFDGYNAEERAILEIKCPNKVDHGKALAGKIPDKYYPQLMQQFLVSGAVKGYYASWDGKSDKLAIVEVLPDASYIANLLREVKRFWALVELQMPPPVTEDDRKSAVALVVSAQKRLDIAIRTLQLTLG
jgi:putative phage-type endonuclease